LILIFSRGEFEVDTDNVIDWLDYLGGDWARLNAEDLTGHNPYAVTFGRVGCHAAFRLAQREVRNDEVRAIWFRRWHRPADFSATMIQDSKLRFTAEHHLMREMRMFSEAIFHLFASAKWLTTPAEARLSKLRALQLASMVGLDTPDTLITNCKSNLQAFKERHRRIITKCIGDVGIFQYAGHNWGLYTREITQENLEAAPETFFPTLFQERLEKLYEVRSFYLDGQFYSMGIFSQSDPKTRDDFRQYNYDQPNRCVPYRLPRETSIALQRLMDLAGLTTGSVDLVRTAEGKLLFLEVNPEGQFGMVSEPCNYFLEKKVAAYLMSLDGGSRRKPEKNVQEQAKRVAIKKVAKKDGPVVHRTPQAGVDLQIGALFDGKDYPLGYRLMGTMADSGNHKLHISESNFHHADIYASYPYHKAISRPFFFESLVRPAPEVPPHGKISI
jgi:ATP-GRASP peptide maturase of grasp-with-spasm system